MNNWHYTLLLRSGRTNFNITYSFRNFRPFVFFSYYDISISKPRDTWTFSFILDKWYIHKQNFFLILVLQNMVYGIFRCFIASRIHYELHLYALLLFNHRKEKQHHVEMMENVIKENKKV